MQERIRRLIDTAWEANLRIDKALLDRGGVHVIAADVGDNDAMSFQLRGTCLVAVSDDRMEAAREVFSSLDGAAAFTAEALQRLLGPDVRVDGPSVHCYVDKQSFTGRPHPAAIPVHGDDPALLDFLQANTLEDWAESGFPRDPATAEATTTRFWILHDGGRVVAAGNMTEWRGLPADVGILTEPGSRSLGFAGRLVSSMVYAALPNATVVRYRALETNVASLAVARRVGFEPYGRNFRARIEHR